ncbi:hypothetical protein [Arthrobacter glacialis]|uniref:hypothetical protein n=1 Tax=Arthrobacter glacialis TaxID=1664 RepID=UPI000CD3CD07|nr:hypothetical protein [Arthrobacter glacialis]POH58270.1 hypothetical protein CVS28_12570 [Arthrobacter glacialis]
MSKIFGIHFAVHNEAGQLHQWSPGDEVPEWVEPMVGDHCILLLPEVSEDPEGTDADEDEESTPSESDPEDAEEDATPEAPAADVSLDFTKPAARRGRAPKKA